MDQASDAMIAARMEKKNRVWRQGIRPQVRIRAPLQA
jgi:hypothetical protein